MTKKSILEEKTLIIEVVEGSPDGLSVEEILKLSRLKLPSRTLQRRLADLVVTGEIKKIRMGKKTLYQIDTAGISSASQNIKNYLLKQSRQAITYNPDFLLRYQPNITTYLSEKVCQHLLEIGTPFLNHRPAGTYAKEIFNRLLIDLSWNSSRLEGNTYSLLETEILLKEGTAAKGKNYLEAQMIYNHKNAIEFLVDSVNEIGINRFTILNLHALLSDNLLRNPQASGSLRKIPVGISGTGYIPLSIPQAIEEQFQKILDVASAIKNPFEQSFFMMVHFPYLQPFEDVNKRVSRLAANIPLIKQNLCPLSFIDVNEKEYIDGLLGVYELNKIDLLRDLYVFAYERSSRRYLTVQNVLGDPDLFRFRYREQLIQVISQVVKQAMNKQSATTFIQQWAANHISPDEIARFVEVTEIELLALHIGNIARFKLTPVEFERWNKVFSSN